MQNLRTTSLGQNLQVLIKISTVMETRMSFVRTFCKTSLRKLLRFARSRNANIFFVNSDLAHLRSRISKSLALPDCFMTIRKQLHVSNRGLAHRYFFVFLLFGKGNEILTVCSYKLCNI